VSGKVRQPGEAKDTPHRELLVRTSSAIMLATLACLLTYAGVIPFSLMMAAGGVILAWEWGRLVREKSNDVVFYAHATAMVAAGGFALSGASWMAFSVLFAGIAITALLASDNRARIWSALGVLYLGLPILIFILLRADPAFGFASIIFLFIIVWSSDTAAYFTGRAIGGPKLAPSISPGKTWAGFAGGLIAPTLLAFGFALWLGTTSVIMLAAVGAGLAVASQLGDLAESAIKRTFQVKDSGNILPGHGGLFDRVDGLIGAALAAGVVAASRSPLEPGKALLIWP
jgi:phosphatidate cytidylyltransferase